MKSLEEMREWLKSEIGKIEWWIKEEADVPSDTSIEEERIEMYQAILAALAEPEPVTEEEKKEMLEMLEAFRKAWEVQWGLSWRAARLYGLIRALIQGNQGGAVSPDTQVPPRGETSGAVTDIPKWAERIHADANLGVMHVQHLLEEMLREAGAAGKEGR